MVIASAKSSVRLATETMGVTRFQSRMVLRRAISLTDSRPGLSSSPSPPLCSSMSSGSVWKRVLVLPEASDTVSVEATCSGRRNTFAGPDCCGADVPGGEAIVMCPAAAHGPPLNLCCECCRTPGSTALFPTKACDQSTKRPFSGVVQEGE